MEKNKGDLNNTTYYEKGRGGLVWSLGEERASEPQENKKRRKRDKRDGWKVEGGL